MLNPFYDKFIFVGEIKFVNNNFSLMEIPFTIIPNNILSALSSTEKEELNKKIYYSAKKIVKESLVNEFNLRPKLEGKNIALFMHDFLSNSGFGLIKDVQVDEKNLRAILVVSNSAVAMQLKGKVGEPCCHLLRGILAGVYSNAFNADLDCLELHCASQNSSECEFIVNKNSAFDFGKENTRKQLDPEI